MDLFGLMEGQTRYCYGEARRIKEETGGHIKKGGRIVALKIPPLRSLSRIMSFFWGLEAKKEVGRAQIYNTFTIIGLVLIRFFSSMSAPPNLRSRTFYDSTYSSTIVYFHHQRGRFRYLE